MVGYPDERLHDLDDGELTPCDQLELQRLKEQIHQESGFFCAGYKERCLRRRLAIRMRARGVHRYGEYGHLLRIDPVEYERSEEGRVGKESRIRRMTNE